MKIYLHLGVHKTASTLIQKSLQISKSHEHSVYPIVRDLHPIIGNKLRLLCNGKKTIKQLESTLQVCLKDAKKKGADTLIISDENLLGNPASVHLKRNDKTLFYPDAKKRIKIISELLGEDLSIILYTRKQETLLRSLYLDGLKYFRYSFSLDKFVQRCINSNFRFDELVSEINSSNIKIVAFETIKAGTDTFIEDFWTRIGKPNAGKTPSKQEQNVAISDLQAELSRHIANQQLNAQEKNAFRKWLSTMPKLPRTESKIVLSQQQTSQIRDRYKDDITYK